MEGSLSYFSVAVVITIKLIRGAGLHLSADNHLVFHFFEPIRSIYYKQCYLVTYELPVMAVMVTLCMSTVKK